jgi:hypothetical protein
MGRTGIPAWRWCACGLIAAACLTATIARTTGAVAQPSDGTLYVSPSPVSAGTEHYFTLEFAATVGFDQGTIALTVPPGWPVPINDASGNSSGDVSCVSGECQNLSVNGSTITIDIAAAFTPTIYVGYWATVPASGAPSATFSAVVQPGPRLQSGQTQTEVTVTPVSATPTPSVTPTPTPTPSATATPTPTPSATPTPSISVTPTPTPSVTTSPTPRSTSPSVTSPTPEPSRSTPPGPPGIWTDVPVASGVVAGFAMVLFTGWRLHRRPLTMAGTSVRAVPRGGPPPRLTVRATGTEPTRTVRIEPHPGTTITSEEPEP